MIDNVNELAVHFMYCNVFVMAFPMAPLLFVANNVIEFNADLFRLFDRRRPIPVAADGLADVWGNVFELIIYLSVVCNTFWCSYHTNLAHLITGVEGLVPRMAFFTIATGTIIALLVVIQVCIKDKPDDVDTHLARQRKVELRMVSRAVTTAHATLILDAHEDMQRIKTNRRVKDEKLQMDASCKRDIAKAEAALRRW